MVENVDPSIAATPLLLVFALVFFGLMLIPIAIGATLDFLRFIKRRRI